MVYLSNFATHGEYHRSSVFWCVTLVTLPQWVPEVPRPYAFRTICGLVLALQSQPLSVPTALHQTWEGRCRTIVLPLHM